MKAKTTMNAILVTIACQFGATFAYGATVADVAPGSVLGKNQERVSIYGHHWNIKPMRIAKYQDGRISVRGQISHNVRFTPDDQVYFAFDFEDGKITSSQIRFRDGGWDSVARTILSPISTVVGPVGKILLTNVDDVIAGIERLAHGNWQTAAQKIATQLALYGWKSQFTISACEHQNLAGRCQEFRAGRFAANRGQLRLVGNDRITSLRIPAGLTVKACRHENDSDCRYYTGNTGHVGDFMNDQISLLVVSMQY